jgi:hypothetical protein
MGNLIRKATRSQLSLTNDRRTALKRPREHDVEEGIEDISVKR